MTMIVAIIEKCIHLPGTKSGRENNNNDFFNYITI